MTDLKPLEAESFADLANHVGATFGPSDWVVVDQAMIDAFAAATNDHAWFHVDVERAKREMPGGVTIAHGLLTLSLTIGMMHGLIKTRSTGGRAFNYGYDRVRFLAPVPAGARIRLRGEVAGGERKPNGMLVRLRLTVEMEGSDKPAMVGDWMELAGA